MFRIEIQGSQALTFAPVARANIPDRQHDERIQIKHQVGILSQCSSTGVSTTPAPWP